MKKLILSSIAIVSFCYGNFIFAENVNTTYPQASWTGFYIGGNAGYWRAQNNTVTTTGSAGFINPSFELGSSNITNALTQIAYNDFTLHPSGFIGGGQIGYNHPFNNGVLLGFNADLDALSNSSNTYNLQKTVNLVDFDESYAGSLVVKQKINYVGTLRARLGYLFYPTLLAYATGGFAYGNVTLNTTWSAQESLGTDVFPTVSTQKKVTKILTGWTAGAGIEWLFKPNWSAALEYTYYDLNNLSAPVTLSQINQSISPTTLWGSASANTTVAVSFGTIRLGINYHFS